MNGKRTKLVNKRHYVHEGKEPFWEGFEGYLINTYGYNPSVHFLVINGDGVSCITACRNHFKNMFFTLDRFHVARDIRSIFKGHRRYRSIRTKLAKYDVKGFMTELNSAGGTLDDERKEEALADLIQQLSKYPEASGDYRKWLNTQGIDTRNMRTMGAAEGTMRVFTRRLKNGRSWSDCEIAAFIQFIVALKDGLMTNKLEDPVESKSAKHPLEKLRKLCLFLGYLIYRVSLVIEV